MGYFIFNAFECGKFKQNIYQSRCNIYFKDACKSNLVTVSKTAPHYYVMHFIKHNKLAYFIPIGL